MNRKYYYQSYEKVRLFLTTFFQEKYNIKLNYHLINALTKEIMDSLYLDYNGLSNWDITDKHSISIFYNTHDTQDDKGKNVFWEDIEIIDIKLI